MKRLLLMRHAKSDWQADALTDFDRPLNKRGRRAATEMGQYLKQMTTPPERVISSPALRARQTVERIFLQTGWRPDRLRFEPRLYMATLETMLDIIRSENDCESALLVGHNPGMEDVLRYLCGSEIERTKKGKLFTTANIADIDLGDQGVDQREQATLIELKRPR